MNELAWQNWSAAACLALGCFLVAVAALGVLRMPDIYMRTQVTTKAATFGIAFIALAASIHFQSVGATTRALLIVAFVVLTTPVAAHMIARSAYRAGTAQYLGTQVDELRNLQLTGQHEALEGPLARNPDSSGSLPSQAGPSSAPKPPGSPA